MENINIQEEEINIGNNQNDQIKREIEVKEVILSLKQSDNQNEIDDSEELFEQE